jgi:short-subunit dehydrogenase
VPGLLIVGAGPGIATAVATRFGRAGMPVTLIARREATLADAQARLAAAGVTDVLTVAADAADPVRLDAALDRAIDARGTPDVLVYNAGWIRFDRPGELDRQGHLDAYAVNVLGALQAAARLAPDMATAGGGTIVFTGGMPTPLPALVSLSLGKAALRALTEMLAAEYAPAGVHVATVTIAGAVAPGSAFDPERIAERYWRLHVQPVEQWQTEILFTGETPRMR